MQLRSHHNDPFDRLLIAQALEPIHDYIAEFDCVANANYVLDRLMEVVEALAQFPERGSYPRELVALGIKQYRHRLRSNPTA